MISRARTSLEGVGSSLEAIPDSVEKSGRADGRVFPPALVPVLRAASGRGSDVLGQLDDELLTHLLNTTFFAGLETHEGSHYPIRVVFTGKSGVGIVMPEGAEIGAAPAYRWKMLRFAVPRPFAIPELVKLAAARTGENLYTAVRLLDSGRIAIVGLARQGSRTDVDPFVELVAEQPGRLSIRSGRETLAEYERGMISRDTHEKLFATPPVRHALTLAARNAGLDDEGIFDYVDTVRALVREMSQHGHGGILVISADDHPRVASSAPYRMARDSSITSLLRLSRRLRPPEPRSARQPQQASYALLLREAFAAEVRRVVEEYGALTSIDGATVLSCTLALVAFGVVLPVSPDITVAPADAELERLTMDLGARGTRHRAAATYAGSHPGSVVFVASEDGPVSCILRERDRAPLMSWRLDPGGKRI